MNALRTAALLALALLLAHPATGSEPDAARDLRLVLKELETCRKDLRLDAAELRTRHDFLPADEWRLPLVDRYLESPFLVVRDAWPRFSPWTESPAGLARALVRAGAELGLPGEMPDAREAKSLEAGFRDVHGSPPGGDPLHGWVNMPAEAKRIPAGARSFLLRLLPAVADSVRARWAAFEKLSDAEWVRLRQYGSQLNTGVAVAQQAPMVRSLHERIDLAAIYRSALGLAAVLDEVPALANEMAKERKRPEFHFFLETGAGRVEIGGFGRNVYRDDVLLSIDLGGDDVYESSAGGTLYTTSKVSVVIDLGGDDSYRTTVGLAQGSGMYGVGVLVDAAGDDLYETKNVSQGSGHVGVGILWDLAGDDRYEGQMMCQGTGFQGIGLLRDDAGRDVYRVGYKGQGFGATQGVGVLQDRAGNDTYVAGGLIADTGRDKSRYLSMAQGCGLGVRADSPQQWMSGGIGILADLAGDDSYRADVFGQGCAYWYAIGVLLDREGRDFYEVYNYGMGAGFHMAVGVCFDRAGDDRYLGRNHALGHALDRSVGFFADFAGDDLYDSRDGESQGAAVKPYAVGIFADLRGDDSYRGGGNGYVRMPGEGDSGPWPKGFFLDQGGADAYASGREEPANATRWTVNRYGSGRDR